MIVNMNVGHFDAYAIQLNQCPPDNISFVKYENQTLTVVYDHTKPPSSMYTYGVLLPMGGVEIPINTAELHIVYSASLIPCAMLAICR